ncbi:glycosyltransferase 52 family protein [Vibrio crassostreae]|uniref:alpha-2,8-polysialyltransferase family protein n=1 Tax=Vibrio crassostreae TaxID=246167 RepID=UPI00200B542B|nr:alpha-2,8-polysialyltransferase family protein [Vibrio crassostreae]UPR28452.1 glycosyltransferase 52 family protein [Vibrio crassostreae]
MNLFVVTSPLQYICALEAKNHFNCQNNILLLVNQKTEHGLQQQKRLIDNSEWQHVVTISRDNRSKQVPQAIKQIKKHLAGVSIEHFFYAEYNGWRTKLLIKNLPVNKEVYFDDGTMTLLEYGNHIIPGQPYYRPRLLVDLKVRFNGCKPIGRLEQSNDLEIFSMFELKQNKFKLHQNNLSTLKQRYGNPELYRNDAPIGFIGQGAIGDKNQVSVDDYVSSINQLVEQTSTDIIYFPHRTEKTEVRKRLMRNPNIQYHQGEYPLEIELIDKQIKLSALVGTYSTVMFTCRKLYPNMPIVATNVHHHDSVFLEELNKQLIKCNVMIIDKETSLGDALK